MKRRPAVPPPPPTTPLKHAGGSAHSLGRLSPETPARGRKSENGAAAALVATRMRAADIFAMTANMAPPGGGWGGGGATTCEGRNVT